MDYITNLSVNGSGVPTVSGNKNGSAVTASIDSVGNITPNAAANVPLDQVIPLQQLGH